MTSISKFSRSKQATARLIKQSMQDCRSLTLALFDTVDHKAFCRQAHPDFSPIGWHLGHIAYTEALWLLQRCGGYSPLFPEYHRLFAQGGLPKGDRVNLPTLTEVCAYLETVRSQVFEYLAIAPIEQQERLWCWLLQHESQHAETITLVLEIQKRSNGWGTAEMNRGSGGCVDLCIPDLTLQMVCVPAGEFEWGNESLDALDNESPVQQGFLETYWIDRTPVTCGAYRSFMGAGGYENSRWWSEAGWRWRQDCGVTQPLYWSDDPIHHNHPVCGVSGYEAQAYAQFVGKRLPTEAEWEKAASWNPVTGRSRYPWGNASPNAARCNHNRLEGTTSQVDRHIKGQSYYGCYDLLGNVWEWTASQFNGYPGFESFPYSGYSQAYFDGAHWVLKGGSWATPPWVLRSAFRNWYYPHTREILAGFRCVCESEP
jgi:gamma-glutamyl hercynylcysteine S-oxide synthase